MNEEDQVRKEAGFEKMSRGWALGGKEFKKELIKEYRERLSRIDLGEDDLEELRRLRWEEVMRRCLETVNKGVRIARLPHTGNRLHGRWRLPLS